MNFVDAVVIVRVMVGVEAVLHVNIVVGVWCHE